MSIIDELIKENCPDGVEYMPLEKVCSICKGVQFNKSNMQDEGTYPVINGGVNPSGFIEQYNQDKNTITISQGGASAGFVNWIQTKFWAGAHCYVLKPNDLVLNRYLYHFVKAQEYKLQECQYGAGIPALGKSTLGSLAIPVPPLEVQREIVRVLDDFTCLTAELTAELQLRKKQYEYYRDLLLSEEMMNKLCPGGVEYRELFSIAEIGTGSSDRKDSLEDGMYPFYVRSKDILRINKYEYDEESIVIPGEGGIGDIFHFVQGKYALHQRAYRIHIIDPVLTTRFLYYYMSTHFKKFIMQKAVSATVTSIRKPMIEHFTVPIPSIEIQHEISHVLDIFSGLCTDITAGLPAEIEARQKQYEYYRDKLLTFREKVQ